MIMQHVTVHVRDVERSIRFYEEFAGLHVTRRLPSGPVFLAAAEGECSMELIQSEAAYAGSGISVGFHVGDVDAQREKLIAAGYEPTPITSPNPSVRFFFVSDPDGLQVQFII